jgi:hypothetical protein
MHGKYKTFRLISTLIIVVVTRKEYKILVGKLYGK